MFRPRRAAVKRRPIHSVAAQFRQEPSDGRIADPAKMPSDPA